MRTPEESLMGAFLFATHTTVFGVTLTYQIPRYLKLELPGLKKPKAKLLPLEIKDWPSLMDWFVVKVSREVENLKKRMIRIKELNIFFFQHILVCADGFLTWNIFYFCFYFLWLRSPQKKRFD